MVKIQILKDKVNLRKRGIKMSNNSTNSSSGGIGFTGLLTVLFIGLKLTGVINWSWLWVLSPMWISLLLVIFVLLVIGVIYIFADK